MNRAALSHTKSEQSLDVNPACLTLSPCPLPLCKHRAMQWFKAGELGDFKDLSTLLVLLHIYLLAGLWGTSIFRWRN